MELLIAGAFVIGIFVGMFLGTLVLSLCAVAGREDNLPERAVIATK